MAGMGKQQQLRTFWRFLTLLWKAFDNVRGKVAMIAFITLFVNRPFARKFLDWEGISPLWALLPIAIVFFWSLVDWLIKTEAERDELRKRLGEPSPDESATSDRSAAQYMLTGGLIAVALVAVGITIGTELISPPVSFDGWHFTEREEKEGLMHDLVDADGKVIATLRDRDTDTIMVLSAEVRPHEETETKSTPGQDTERSPR